MKPKEIVCFLCLAVFAAGGIARAQSDRATPSTDGLHCDTFQWTADDNSPKAAMLVPITLDGRKYWYQLDTGADVVSAYGTAPHKTWIARKDFSAVRSIQFAGMSLQMFPVFSQKQIDASKDVQGTVGLDILIGHTFLIDFPKQKVCLLNRGELPDSLNNAASWTPAELRQGKLFLTSLNLNGNPLPNVIYDTGTSSDALVLDLALWQKATARNPADATSHRLSSTWGQKVEYIATKATGALTIGDRSFPKPLLTASPSRPTDFHDNVYGASGALGNALLTNAIVILDLGSHPEFGIIEK